MFHIIIGMFLLHVIYKKYTDKSKYIIIHILKQPTFYVLNFTLPTYRPNVAKLPAQQNRLGRPYRVCEWFKPESSHINFDTELHVVTSWIKCHQVCSDLKVLCKIKIMERCHNYGLVLNKNTQKKGKLNDTRVSPDAMPRNIKLHGIALQNIAISLFTPTITSNLMQNITVKGTVLQSHQMLCLQAIKVWYGWEHHIFHCIQPLLKCS
jgi:hypothetical protein